MELSGDPILQQHILGEFQLLQPEQEYIHLLEYHMGNIDSVPMYLILLGTRVSSREYSILMLLNGL